MNEIPEGYEKIYKYTDSKPYFLNWEIDIFVLFSIFFGLGLMLASGFLQLVFFVFLGVMSANFYSKIKNSKVKGVFFHYAYMLGIKKTKTLLPSYMRYFIGG